MAAMEDAEPDAGGAVPVMGFVVSGVPPYPGLPYDAATPKEGRVVAGVLFPWEAFATVTLEVAVEELFEASYAMADMTRVPFETCVVSQEVE